MKAIELRMGNIALNSSNEAVTVREISNTLVKTTPDDIHLISELKPIPLTEEILLKCGFEKHGNFYYIKSFKSIYISRPWLEANHLLLKTLGGECISKVKHLHQLQNLYFALCGEELEVKL